MHLKDNQKPNMKSINIIKPTNVFLFQLQKVETLVPGIVSAILKETGTSRIDLIRFLHNL
jgi:hypothetical protein